MAVAETPDVAAGVAAGVVAPPDHEQAYGVGYNAGESGMTEMMVGSSVGMLANTMVVADGSDSQNLIFSYPKFCGDRIVSDGYSYGGSGTNTDACCVQCVRRGVCVGCGNNFSCNQVLCGGSL